MINGQFMTLLEPYDYIYIVIRLLSLRYIIYLFLSLLMKQEKINWFK